MTVCAAGPFSDKELLGFANYALKLVNKPHVVDVDEVNASLLVNLSAHLFGPELFRTPLGSISTEADNVTAILKKLSSEINADLDHIDAGDVIRGKRRPLSNLLELVTAYIHCCYEAPKTVLERSCITQKSCQNYSSGSSPSKTSDDFGLETSPELPRSVGRPCQPLRSNSFRDANLTHDANERFEKYQKDGWRNSSTKHRLSRGFYPQIEAHSPFYPHRHPSILSMQVPMSPPTTPKAADEFLEIVNHQSSDLASSLDSSFNDCALSPKHDFVSPEEIVPNVIPNLSTSPDQRFPVTIVSEDKLCGDPCDSLLGCTVPTTTTSHDRHRKVSSSSSGCGPSPTHTLTVPGGSGTSAPTSLSESLHEPPKHAAAVSEPLPTVQRKHVKAHKTSQILRPEPVADACPTTTDSILAYNNDEEESTREAIDDLTSLLSSSFHVESTVATNSVGPRPSALTLITQSEKFIESLNGRLDYLKSIFHRAHEESEAIGRLIKAIDVRKSGMLRGAGQRWSSTQEEESFGASKKLEQALDKILFGVDTLLNRTHKTRAHRHTEDSFNCVRTPTPSRYSRKSLQLSSRRSHLPCWNRALDDEYEKLLDLKHKLMIDALQLCHSELSCNVPSSTRPLHPRKRRSVA